MGSGPSTGRSNLRGIAISLASAYLGAASTTASAGVSNGWRSSDIPLPQGSDEAPHTLVVPNAPTTKPAQATTHPAGSEVLGELKLPTKPHETTAQNIAVILDKEDPEFIRELVSDPEIPEAERKSLEKQLLRCNGVVHVFDWERIVPDKHPLSEQPELALPLKYQQRVWKLARDIKERMEKEERVSSMINGPFKILPQSMQVQIVPSNRLPVQSDGGRSGENGSADSWIGRQQYLAGSAVAATIAFAVAAGMNGSRTKGQRDED